MRFQTKAEKIIFAFVLGLWILCSLVLFAFTRELGFVNVIQTIILSVIFPVLYLIILWPFTFDFAKRVSKVRVIVTALFSLFCAIVFWFLEIYPPSNVPTTFYIQ
jgi:hypothetical protein